MKPINPPPDHATVVIRMPKALHAGLRTLAFENRESMNTTTVNIVKAVVERHSVAAAAMKRGTIK